MRGENRFQPHEFPHNTQENPSPISGNFENNLPNQGLPLVKPVPLQEVCLGLLGNFNNHGPTCKNRLFASCHEHNRACPCSSCFLRESRISRCHSGDFTSPECLQRLSQRSSKSRTFSATLKDSKGSSMDIITIPFQFQNASKQIHG